MWTIFNYIIFFNESNTIKNITIYWASSTWKWVEKNNYIWSVFFLLIFMYYLLNKYLYSSNLSTYKNILIIVPIIYPIILLAFRSYQIISHSYPIVKAHGRNADTRATQFASIVFVLSRHVEWTMVWGPEILILARRSLADGDNQPDGRQHSLAQHRRTCFERIQEAFEPGWRPRRTREAIAASLRRPGMQNGPQTTDWFSKSSRPGPPPRRLQTSHGSLATSDPGG